MTECRDPACALDHAEAFCAARGVRLTPMRRAVLETLLCAGRPLGAYELLDRLRPAGHPALAPPAIYRSLDFLLALGLVHRLETIRAYLACLRPDHGHVGQFLICNTCGGVTEADDDHLSEAARLLAARTGFLVQSQALELTGVCAGCRQ